MVKAHNIFSLGLGSEPSHYHDETRKLKGEYHPAKVKPDHILISLSPNKSYSLYLRSNSQKPSYW